MAPDIPSDAPPPGGASNSGEDMARTILRWKRARAPRRISDVVQAMPGMRVRLNPAVIPDIAQWVLTLRQQYERAGQMTLSGLKGTLRVRRQGQIAWARAMCEAYDSVARQLYDTLDARAFDSVRREWEGAVPNDGA